MRTTIFSALFIFCCSLGLSAQKIGYVNSQLLLSEMPEMKAAESDLVAFRDQQEKLLKMKMDAAQAEYQSLAEKEQAGELTPKQLQAGQESLQGKQVELQEMEADINDKLAKRREEKFQPVFDMVNKAIADIAKEGGFTYVFDASTNGVIVYADETLNLTEQVKTKLMETN